MQVGYDWSLLSMYIVSMASFDGSQNYMYWKGKQRSAFLFENKEILKRKQMLLSINWKRFENLYSCTIILLFYFCRLLRRKRKGSSKECPIFSLDVQETNKQQTTLKILFRSRCFLTQNNVNLKLIWIIFIPHLATLWVMGHLIIVADKRLHSFFQN